MSEQLPPGRELDALVAQKVMGLDVQKDQVTKTGGIFAKKESDDPWEYFLGASGELVPPYSTDQSAAWSVVEHLRKTHWRDCFALYSPSDECDKWFARFDKKWHGYGGGIEVYDANYGVSAPHAICQAALEVVANS